jgi:hypothetical protein
MTASLVWPVQAGRADQVAEAVLEAAVVAAAAALDLARPFSFAVAALDCAAAFELRTLVAVAAAVVVVATVAVVPSYARLVVRCLHQPFVVVVVVGETSSSEGYPCRQILVLEQVADSIVFELLLALFELPQELQEEVESLAFLRDCSSCRGSFLVDLFAFASCVVVAVASAVADLEAEAGVLYEDDLRPWGEVKSREDVAVVADAAKPESTNLRYFSGGRFRTPSCSGSSWRNSSAPFAASSSRRSAVAAASAVDAVSA